MGFAFTSLGGTLLHFVYDLSNGSKTAALFSGVNESTWEHMKLLFFPMFAFAIVQSFFFKERCGFWLIKLKGILLGLIAIPLIFCTYNGVIGKSPDAVNIAIFFIAAAIAYIYEGKALARKNADGGAEVLSVVCLCVIAVAFMVFTFFPPMIRLFEDPITHTYGINQV